MLPALIAVTGTPALAQHAGHGGHTLQPNPHAGHDMGAAAPTPSPTMSDPHAGHGMGGSTESVAGPPAAPPPAAAFEGPLHAADALFDPSAMAAAREQLRAEQGEMRTYRVLIDRLEARLRDDRDGYLWDAEGWYGGDIDKLWLKTEGEGAFSEKPGQVEVQALWSHAVTPWFDAQAGLRYDFRPDPERAHLVVGLQGLAPYFFEIDAAAFLSDEGDLTARIEAEYDQLITQKLVLQPRVELNASAQDVDEIDVGAGLSSVEAGLRLRYEFTPEFAPYIGVGYERKVGETADFARAEGEDAASWSILLGIRTWF